MMEWFFNYLPYAETVIIRTSHHLKQQREVLMFFFCFNFFYVCKFEPVVSTILVLPLKASLFPLIN